LAELHTRPWQPKFDRYLSLEAHHAILRDARAAALWVNIPPELAAQHWRRDPTDDAFIRTALAAQAPWLVTGDEDLLTVPAIEGRRIVTPGQALALFV
jgi:putative PIN family toxin of toxin-antitoxin system